MTCAWRHSDLFFYTTLYHHSICIASVSGQYYRREVGLSSHWSLFGFGVLEDVCDFLRWTYVHWSGNDCCVPLVALVYIQTMLSMVNNALYSTSDA